MRFSSLSSLAGITLFAIGACGSWGCNITKNPDGSYTLKPKDKLEAPGQTKTAQKDWTHQAIVVTWDAPDVISNGGLEVIGDPSITKVTLTARVVALGDNNAKAEMQQSIDEASATLAITETADTITVSCGHGGTHGNSAGGSSGCEKLSVRVPSGSASTPVTLTVTATKQDFTVSGITGGVSAKAAFGAAAVSITPAKGAAISVTAHDKATLALPNDFAADSITLETMGLQSKVISADFPDVSTGKPRGAAGSGAASVVVKSEDDDVTLQKL